ncbi:hypothetical protein D9615_004316 [Tricholomella constricta]|uniref:Metal homeostatis protein bsd2 n=1 Tax=Tricholomella constricta TaxID=117010 RepID=A0A8H5M5Y6_9AGAR|nr:hypothetical protein D9615_004316 [Tricholomella constricta]
MSRYQELHDAFESDSDDDHDDHHHHQHPSRPATVIPGAYDFERDRAYDHPPPGSPPPPSSRALPNDYGNSNGQLPTSTVRRTHPTPSFFRRAVGALLPSHYVQVPTSDPSSQASRTVIGAGIENDGVFANVMAKPQPSQVVQSQDGSIYMVPEDNQKEVPPSYSDAQADAVPPYWETTVHAPLSAIQDPSADMVIDDLPTGGFWLFAINLFISYFFQFVGFLFTYLLHTSHAAKFGSRAGLGLTLIQFGFYSRQVGFSDDTSEVDKGAEGTVRGWPGTQSADTNVTATAPMADDSMLPVISSKDWLAFLFMTLGWFIFLSSIIGYARIKRWERSIRAAAQPTPVSPEAVERDIAIRRNIASVFGVAFEDEEEVRARARLEALQQQDARLTRDLQAAGLL